MVYLHIENVVTPDDRYNVSCDGTTRLPGNYCRKALDYPTLKVPIFIISNRRIFVMLRYAFSRVPGTYFMLLDLGSKHFIF